MTLRAAALALLLAPSLSLEPAAAGAPAYPTVPADVVAIVDGDTIDVIAYPWPGWSKAARVRILAIDTPETRRPACDRERDLGELASETARSLLEGRSVGLIVEGRDSFGRLLAHVIMSDGRDYGAAMIGMGLALPYELRRQGWGC